MRVPRKSAAPCGRNRRVHGFDRMRIFRADVDVALCGADGDGGDGHALDHHEGIALHDHAVGKGAAVAFVGVADDVFAARARVRHRLPLDAGRETCAAAAAQARRRDVGEDRIRRQRQRALQPLVAAMGAVIVERAGVADAAAGEGEAGLALQPGNSSATPSRRMCGPLDWPSPRTGRGYRPGSPGHTPRGPSRSPPRPSAPANKARASRFG